MNWDQRCVRFCTVMLLCTIMFRLGTMGIFSPVVRSLQSREAISFFLYLQTGRVVRLQADAPAQPVQQEPPDPTVPDTKTPLNFSAPEADLIQITGNSGYRPDLAELLTQPLPWDLTGDEPAVLILHTHATESYTPGEGECYEATDYRTRDPEYNMLCLGNLVARRLEEAGIRCIHDTQLHDSPSYNDSYANAAASTQAILEQYPSIQLVLDLHRDAADTAYGQMVTECSIGSETAAQLMFVVGTDASGLNHPDWEQNLSLALKLQVLLERQNPGICRDLNLTRNRYNQHLGSYALLIEIGAAGNTLAEATLAAEKLAQAIIQLRYGAGSTR